MSILKSAFLILLLATTVPVGTKIASARVQDSEVQLRMPAPIGITFPFSGVVQDSEVKLDI
jgi:hypothetical protein